MIFGGHGHKAVPEAGVGGVAIEDGAALGIDVEDVEGAGAVAELSFDATEERFEDGCLEGVEEEGEGGSAGKVVVECVLLEEARGGDFGGRGIGGVGGLPDVQIGLGYVGHVGVELDADDLMEGKLAGEEHGSAFAGAAVDEGVAGDWVGRECGEPVIDEGAEDAGSDAVVGGDVGVVGVASGEVTRSDEAAGFGTVDLVEGMDRGFDFLGFAWGHGLADLDQGWVAVEAEGSAACGGDVLWGPGR